MSPEGKPGSVLLLFDLQGPSPGQQPPYAASGMKGRTLKAGGPEGSPAGAPSRVPSVCLLATSGWAPSGPLTSLCIWRGGRPGPAWRTQQPRVPSTPRIRLSKTQSRCPNRRMLWNQRSREGLWLPKSGGCETGGRFPGVPPYPSRLAVPPKHTLPSHGPQPLLRAMGTWGLCLSGK